MKTPLQKAAQALINRWDSPAWKDQPHTADYIEELRKALDAERARGNYAEGVECNRLCDALTFMGVAGPKSMEELAFNMSESVNRLTRSVMELKGKREIAQTETVDRNLRVTEQSVEPHGWLEAVDKEMVCAHLGVANVTDTFDEANAKLLALINWHVAVATDPAVNGGLSLQPQATIPVPDLLKEFKNVMSWIDNWSPEFSCDPDWPDDRDKAHAAIAAAQGEKP